MYPQVQIKNVGRSKVVLNDSMVYVTVKFPGSIIPECEKISTIVWPGDSLAKVAKELRIQRAELCKTFISYEGHKIKPKPSQLSWAVYTDLESRTPILVSENWS